jgi:hypothetical protein
MCKLAHPINQGLKLYTIPAYSGVQLHYEVLASIKINVSCLMDKGFQCLRDLHMKIYELGPESVATACQSMIFVEY